MIPALLPNSAAVLFGGGTPVDFGKTWKGRRLLGEGKTWRGFFGGALTGMLFGALQIVIALHIGEEVGWGYGELPWALATVAALSFGSMTGDSIGSFAKRRFGVDRGSKAPVLDQYNFVLGAIVFVLVISPSWFMDHYFHENGVWGLVLFLVMVPILHRSANIIGYKLGKKDVPW
jgi:CDP-2,3-bis-(O-geranylgeranyl)-sn-glycerol synthase